MQTLKQRISKESLDGNVVVEETRGTKGLGKGETRGNEGLRENVGCSVETGEGNVIPMNLRFSDDSDEEHRMLRGSSDGSQYGSDSGMGDSLMNTLASECTDGVSKTPTVSPVNNIARKELEVDDVSDSGDTICAELSPINEHDIDGIMMASDHIAQTKPESECERNKRKQKSQGTDHTTQAQDRSLGSTNLTLNNFKRTPLRLEDELPVEYSVPLDHITHKTSLVLDQDTDENSLSTMVPTVNDNRDIAEDNSVLTNIAENIPPTSHECNTTVSETDPSTVVGYGQLMEIDQESESDSLEYLRLPQVTLDKDSQSQNNIDVDSLKLRTIPHADTELKDQTNTDSHPFIPEEFLLPEHASTDQNRQKAYSEQAPSEIIPFEQTPYEITPSEQTSSEDSSENNYPQTSRVHDIDEELLWRGQALQNVYTDEGVGEEPYLVNGTDYPLVSCVPPPMKTVEEFVEEPDALFQRLVDIEVMLRPQGKDEENLKSALLKHVVSNI